MGRKRLNKEEQSSPPKRRKYDRNMKHGKLAHAAGKPKNGPLAALPCYICVSTSNEGLLPLEEQQPYHPVSRCYQNGGIWMVHRTCAQLLNGLCVFKPDNSGEEVIRGLQSVVADRFKLKCVTCTHPELRAHGAKIQCSKGLCGASYHPVCAKMADGVGLTEVKKTEAIDYGTEETIEYELWCRKHNPDILEARRAIRAAGKAKLYAELEAAKPGTTVSYTYAPRGIGYVPFEGKIVQNDIQERKMLISDGEEVEWYGWNCIVGVIGGKSSDESHPPESPKETPTPTPIQDNTVQPGVQKDVSSSGMADPLPATQLVFESPDPAPQSHQGTLRINIETKIWEPATTRPTLKGKSEPKATTPPTPVAPSTSSTEVISWMRTPIYTSPPAESRPLSHEPTWDLTTLRAKDQQIQPEFTDSVAPETPQDLVESSPVDSPPDSPLSNHVGDTWLQSHLPTSETVLQEVMRRIANSPTFSEQAMCDHQVAALLSPLIIPAQNQALVDIDEQLSDVEGEALLGENGLTELLITSLEVEGDRVIEAPIDPNDTSTGTCLSISEFITFPESDTAEEEQSLLVPRAERSKSPPVLQGRSLGVQCDIRYIEVGVQTDDTVPPACPDCRRAACNEDEVMRPSLRRATQMAEWKDGLDKMPISVQYDLWRGGWVKDRESTTM